MTYPPSSHPPDSAQNGNHMVYLEQFLEKIQNRGLSLYPAQEEALLELWSGHNVILQTPTGSGKSLVASGLHHLSLMTKTRSVYTSPIKALANEKFFSLCSEFGPDQVGLLTGDASVNPEAPIICCTAEVLANLCLRKGADIGFDDIIIDEFHYYSDKERGMAWQIPLLTLSKSRFLLMSATLSEMQGFVEAMTRLNGRQTVWIERHERPVPLEYEYRETYLHETVRDLFDQEKAPIYIVSFSQREAAETAQNLLSTDFLSKEQKLAIQDELGPDVRWNSPYGKVFSRLIRHGVGLHHAGLLPRYRRLVERLAQKGLLKIICGTDTLGVGVNIPIRSVVLTQLCKYDGEKTGILSVRDFRQITGRAGRRGFDNIGYVYAQAPEHVVENKRMELKAAGDPKKLRKIVRKKPPTKNYVAWDKSTFQRLIDGKPEPLISRFQVTQSVLLNILSRPHGAGCEALRDLIRNSHEPETRKPQHRRTSFQILRSLLERRVLTWTDTRPKELCLHADLQEDFSLDQSLSLFLIDGLGHLDPMTEDYSLNVLSFVESIIENPEYILRQQAKRARDEKWQELKEQGVEHDDRVLQVEEVEHPKPLADLIYSTFNSFAEKHPWIGSENIRPKSIAREIYEKFMNFDDYIREYELSRIEGVLLRYLTEVYKILVQSVPDLLKNDEIDQMTAYFESLVQETDASLLDEWMEMKDPTRRLHRLSREAQRDQAEKIRIEKQNFYKNLSAWSRNNSLRFMRSIDQSLRLLPSTRMTGFEAESVPAFVMEMLEGSDWTWEKVINTAQEFLNSSEEDSTDPATVSGSGQQIFAEQRQRLPKGLTWTTEARGSRYSVINRDEEASAGCWYLQQILFDAQGPTDWCLHFKIDIAKSLEKKAATMTLINFASINFHQ